jgi:dTDP-4-dehydrorhamnose 3,5-epimerase
VRFQETAIEGAFIVDIDPIEDERGFFARSWCADEFQDHGLDGRLVQSSISFNTTRGTLRGMHYQAAPHAEAKLVRCTAGALFDVIADVRERSPSRGRWFGVALTAANRRMLYIPAGVAHGFQTTEDETEVLYQMSEAFHPESARGFRWDDPELAIDWPIADPILSAADRIRRSWRESG